ncbi:uncharacterized protein LOC141902213 [Tubulanus polymorphus]|uniref:uncharacterized protein LOC141902213 n=1 Tax=Tubulanus polymorphus TaxID=672921 RepID=UPI003DA3161C
MMAEKSSDSEALTVVIEKLTEICSRVDPADGKVTSSHAGATTAAAFVPAATPNRVSSIVVRNTIAPPKDVEIFKCDECDYSSHNKYYLKQHIDLVHSADRPYKCPFCDYAGKRSSALKEHLIVHSNDRPFECSHCNATFRKKGHLTNHIKMHASRAAQCCFCNQQANSLDELFAHIETCRARRRDGVDDETIYACGTCGYASADQESVNAHVADKHASAPADAARVVETKSSSEDGEVARAAGTILQCAECGFSTESHGTMQKHVIEHIVSTENNGKDASKVKVTAEQTATAAIPASKMIGVNSESARFSFDESLGIFRCMICGYTCEHQRTIKSHVWKHSGHKDVDYPMFQNGPLSMYDGMRLKTAPPVIQQTQAKSGASRYRVFKLDSPTPARREAVTLSVPIAGAERVDLVASSDGASDVANKGLVIIVEKDASAMSGVAGHGSESDDKVETRKRPIDVDASAADDNVAKKIRLSMDDSRSDVSKVEVEKVTDTCPLVAVKPDGYSVRSFSPCASLKDHAYPEMSCGSPTVVSSDVEVAEVVVVSSSKKTGVEKCHEEMIDGDDDKNVEESNADDDHVNKDSTDGLVIVENAERKKVAAAAVSRSTKRVLRSSSNNDSKENNEKKSSGICSSLLAVIEQLRERSQSETGANEAKAPPTKPTRQRRNRAKQTAASVVDDGIPVESLANVEFLDDAGSMRCQLCHYQSRSSVYIKQHMRLHKIKKPFECSLCEHVAESSSRLQDHMLQHCKVRTYKCTLCPGNFNYKSQLRAHMRAHNEQEPFVCDICGSESKNPIAFRNHMRSHTCVTCNDVYKKTCEEKQHSRAILQTDGVYRCDECAFAGADEDELNKHHRQSHAKLFKCEQCDYACATLAAIRNHCRAAHTQQERVMRCSLCDFSATSIRSLKSHMKRHVNDQRYVQQPLEQYKCNLCGYVCHHLPSLKSHMWRHSSERSYSYQLANNIINAAVDFDNHVKPASVVEEITVATAAIPTKPVVVATAAITADTESHPLVTFRCCQCGYESTNRSNLAAHMKEHVDIIAQTLEIGKKDANGKSKKLVANVK